MARRTAKRRDAKPRARVSGEARLYTLGVFLFSGPMTEGFLRKNKVVSRTI